jgi:hypothetical protein
MFEQKLISKKTGQKQNTFVYLKLLVSQAILASARPPPGLRPGIF